MNPTAEYFTTTGLCLWQMTDIRREFHDFVRGYAIDAPSYLPTGQVFLSAMGTHAMVAINPREMYQ
jgi:hypothetical protein